MTVYRIAKEAGVSTATVSRVINNHPLVSDESRQKVEFAIKKIGYVPPDPMRRRGPRTQVHRGIRTRTIAVLLSGLERPLGISSLHAKLLHGVEMAMSRKNFNLILSQFNNLGELPPAVTTGAVDGLLMEGQPPSPEVAAKLRRFPSVWLLTKRSSELWGDSIEPDNRAIGELAANYLMERGHRRLAFMNLEPNLGAFVRRAEAFESTARAAGADVHMLVEGTPHRAPVFLTSPEEAEVEVIVDRLLALSPRPTGIFIPFDMLTAMVYRVLKARGVEPGRDILIVSCINEWLGLNHLGPGTVSIDLQVELIGKRAVEQLLWRMANPNEQAGMRVLIPPELLEPSVSTM